MIDDGVMIIPSWTSILQSYKQTDFITKNELSDAFRYLHDKEIILISEISLNEESLKK